MPSQLKPHVEGENISFNRFLKPLRGQMDRYSWYRLTANGITLHDDAGSVHTYIPYLLLSPWPTTISYKTNKKLGLLHLYCEICFTNSMIPIADEPTARSALTPLH